MYVESFRLKKVNTSIFKKLHELDLENESLQVKREELANRLNELRVEKES